MRIIFNKIFVLLLLVAFFINASAQKGSFQFRGRVISQTKEKIGAVNYKVYKNEVFSDSTKTSSNGAFMLKLELNNVYLIEFSKNAYTSKKIIVDTNVPKDKSSSFYDWFNIIKLDNAGEGDTRSLAGLPVLKYYYKLEIADFAAEKIMGKKPVGGTGVSVKQIKDLEAELISYQAIINEQMLELERVKSGQNLTDQIIAEANRKADSIINVAKRKALFVLLESKKDSADRQEKIDRAVSDISNEDFKDLSVDKEKFREQENIKNIERNIQTLKERQNKSATDSLNLKENKLSLRREFIDLAKTQLEIDRLKAKTHEDSLRIDQREAELFLIEQDMAFAANEIESARKEIKLKDLELQKKNLIIYGVILGFILLLVVLVVIYYHYRDKKKMNIILESQNLELENQNNQIKSQNKQLKKQNHQIMASINYGKRIQEAILPSNQLLSHFFPESFVFFLPRDVVSGDFYWLSVQGDKLFVAAVDCTGHGVPGAFMSLIGNSLLNHIVNEKGVYKPSEILKELHTGVKKALTQSKSESDDNVDGMDMTLCCFDKSTKEIQLACANHTAFIINNDEVQEIEGDEFSIADELIGDDVPEFTNHVIPMNKNATLYMFSDGFPDQFGGPKNKKFYTGKLKELFIKNQQLSATDQYDVLNKTFTEWKGENKQLDDVLVMGFKLYFV